MPVSCTYTVEGSGIIKTLNLVLIKIYCRFVSQILTVYEMKIPKNKNAPLIISYYGGWTFKEDGGIQIKVPDDHQEVVVINHTKRFHNCIYLLAALSPCARNLMDWLTEEMTDTNIVYHTAGSRRIFSDFLASITNNKIKYADQTVKQAWAELAKSGLIIARPTKATFMVHPKFFFKGNDSQRVAKIIAQLTFENKGVDNFRIYYDKKLNTITEKK